MEESEKQPMGKREPRRHDILENKEESIPRKRDLHQMFQVRTRTDHRI